MDGSGSPLPGWQGGRRRCRWVPAALGAATLLLALPAVAPADPDGAGQRFPTSEEACDYIATQARGKAFLCPASLPARVVSERSRFTVEYVDVEGYALAWRPEKRRPRLVVQRMPRDTLRIVKAVFRRDPKLRDGEVRGRPAIRGCLKRFRICLLVWRERSSAYIAVGRHVGISRTRLRRDLRSTARALVPVAPDPTSQPPPPPEPDDGYWSFRTAAEACGFVADKVRRPPALCPVNPPDRLRPRGGIELFGEFGGPERWTLGWQPRETRGVMVLLREPKRALRQARSEVRRSGGRLREVRVRGRRGFMSCGGRRGRDSPPLCYLAWRELGSTYSIVRLADISLDRIRRDVRAIARSLEPVSAPEASQAAWPVAPGVLQH